MRRGIDAQSLARKAFVGFFPAAALSGVVLWLGLAATGGGHGIYTVWYLGLALSFLSWLLLLVSVGAGIASRLETGRLPGVTFPGILILVILTGLGIWGLGG